MLRRDVPTAARALAPRPEPLAVPLQAMHRKLRAGGLRPTRQRVMLSALLFGRGDRHVSAEELYSEAREAGIAVSLATIYNTLHGFARCGLLREVAVLGGCCVFDTNTTEHSHYFDEETGRIFDLPQGAWLSGRPEPPPGYEIVRCDVIVRLKRHR